MPVQFKNKGLSAGTVNIGSIQPGNKIRIVMQLQADTAITNSVEKVVIIIIVMEDEVGYSTMRVGD